MHAPVYHSQFVGARILKALGDLGAARRLLEELVELYATRGLHRFADRYRRELAALDASARD